jgi:phospholipid-binding lipoprotein MlaA
MLRSRFACDSIGPRYGDTVTTLSTLLLGELARRHRLARSTALVLVLCGAVFGWSAPDHACAQAPGQLGAAHIRSAALRTDRPAGPLTVGQREPDTSLSGFDQAEQEFEEYDPWEPFNEKAFKFNYELDRHAIKPVAKGYDRVVPSFIERAITNIFDNIGAFRRIINLAIQGRPTDSGQEFGRFVINTFFGLGGVVDAAPSFGVGKVDADTAQTLGLFGVGPGPFLMVPLFPPLTVREAVGLVFDSAMDPTTWLVPFEFGFTASAVRRINERALSLELFDNVEETTFDLYGAVRNGYLQQRRALVREARTASRWYLKPTGAAEPPAAPTPPAEPSDPPAPRQDASLAATRGSQAGRGRPDEESFLIVDASPSDAEVYLDGGAVGTAGELLAHALALPHGRHTVTVAAEGFKTYVATFEADPSFPARVRATLERSEVGDGNPGTRVTGLPPSAPVPDGNSVREPRTAR